MAKEITVTGAEQSAARYIVRRNEAKGVPTRSSVAKIANAKWRSASSGRYVSRSSAAKDSRAS